MGDMSVACLLDGKTPKNAEAVAPANAGLAVEADAMESSSIVSAPL